MSFQALSAERYTVRQFSDTPIEPEKLNCILETGRLAPTAHNQQPQRILVVTDLCGLAKIDLATPCRYGAPVVLLICYDRTVCWKRPFDGQDSGQVDASIVTDQMMLQAVELGLGTTWVMFFDPAKIAAQFQLPETIVPVAILNLGYPDAQTVPSDNHGERHALAEILL